MSSQTWTVTGIGFNLDECKKKECLKVFLINHKKTLLGNVPNLSFRFNFIGPNKEKPGLKEFLLEFYDYLEKDKNQIINFDDFNGKYYPEFKTEIVDDNSNEVGNALVLVAEIISLETGIPFSYYRGESNWGCIMLPEMLPWMYPEKVKNLSMDTFDKIVTSYEKELDCNIDYTSVEYYG